MPPAPPRKSHSRRWLLPLLLTLLAATLFARYGRSWWVPIKYRLQGKPTVAGVCAGLEQRQPGLARLVPPATRELTIVVLKQERRLELWADRQRLASYPLTAFSGQLGPKQAEGDRQIPEGIYRIELLNPASSYHLSLKLDYPNDFDRRQAVAAGQRDPGSDIYIHGKAVSIGCVSLGDAAIEELFYAVARIGKEKVRVLLLPYDLRQGRQPQLEPRQPPWTAELYATLEKEVAPYRSASPAVSGRAGRL